MRDIIYGIFDSSYILGIVGAILVLIASIALSIMLFIFSTEIKEDIARRRKAIISGILILLVGFCGFGFLIYLSNVFN